MDSKIVAGYVTPVCPHCDEEVDEPPSEDPMQCPNCKGWIRVRHKTVYLAEQVFDYDPSQTRTH